MLIAVIIKNEHPRSLFSFFIIPVAFNPSVPMDLLMQVTSYASSALNYFPKSNSSVIFIFR